jgi:prepilin-type N-terminal cleavage/methylation domain-containing protein
MSGQRRSGFTLVELMMVVLIVGLLAALLLPAINSARESGRRAVCLHKMRQVALAVQQYENANTHYPGWRHFFRVDNNQTHNTSWTVLALPYLERGDVFRSFKQQGATPENMVSLRELLVCPSDFAKLAAEGPVTSFIGNTGREDRFDLAEQNDVPPDWRTNGVFLHIQNHEETPAAMV